MEKMKVVGDKILNQDIGKRKWVGENILGWKMGVKYVN